MTFLLVVHLFCCLFMTGVIWLVQTLVYPQYRFLAATDFAATHEFHKNRITWIVAPIMSLELITGLVLAYQAPNLFFGTNLVGVGLIWIWTAFVNVPTHEKLKHDLVKSKDELVQMNWPRTLIWSARSVALLTFICLSHA